MSSTDPGVAKLVVTTVEDGSIGEAKLANSAVTTTRIADEAVTTAKIAAGAVTAVKIADSILSLAKLDALLTSLTQGATDRPPCRIATTTNITVAGSAPDTYDDIALQMGDRVLLTGQTAPAENGIYYVSVLGTGANGTWSRAIDGDTNGDLFGGVTVFIQQGTVGALKRYTLTTAGVIDIGVTAQMWTEIAGGGGVEDHDLLNNLTWDASGHVGDADTIAAFGAAGAAEFLALPLDTGLGGTGLASPGASGNVLTSNGTDWTSATPALFSPAPTPEFASDQVIVWNALTTAVAGTQALGTGTLYYWIHHEEGNGHTYVAMHAGTTAGVGTLALGLYAVNSDDQPGDLLWSSGAQVTPASHNVLFSSGTWTVAGAAYKDGSDQLVLVRGQTVYMAVQLSANITIRVMQGAQIRNMGFRSDLNLSGYTGFNEATAYPTFPATATPVAQTTGNRPVLGLRPI